MANITLFYYILLFYYYIISDYHKYNIETYWVCFAVNFSLNKNKNRKSTAKRFLEMYLAIHINATGTSPVFQTKKNLFFSAFLRKNMFELCLFLHAQGMHI